MTERPTCEKCGSPADQILFLPAGMGEICGIRNERDVLLVKCKCGHSWQQEPLDRKDKTFTKETA